MNDVVNEPPSVIVPQVMVGVGRICPDAEFHFVSVRFLISADTSRIRVGHSPGSHIPAGLWPADPPSQNLRFVRLVVTTAMAATFLMRALRMTLEAERSEARTFSEYDTRYGYRGGARRGRTTVMPKATAVFVAADRHSHWQSRIAKFGAAFSSASILMSRKEAFRRAVRRTPITPAGSPPSAAHYPIAPGPPSAP